MDISNKWFMSSKMDKLFIVQNISTGLPSDATRSTKTGCWYIKKDKKLEYTLTGADYTTSKKLNVGSYCMDWNRISLYESVIGINGRLNYIKQEFMDVLIYN